MLKNSLLFGRTLFITKSLRRYIVEDIKITCKDCGEEFVFSIKEQEFYKQLGFESQPVRCKACRQKRKAARENANETAAN